MSDFTPLEGSIKKRPFLVLDVESKDDNTQKAGFTRPFMVGVYDGEEYHAFFDRTRKGWWKERYWMPGGCVDQAMRFILQKKYRGHHIYAHNAGRFDYLFITPWLMGSGQRHQFKFSIIPVASAIQVLDIWRGNKHARWRFLDSYKLIPTGLDKIAKTFGFEGKLQHDLDMHESDHRWVDYNRVDCEQLYVVLEKFHHYIENVLCGEVGITAPATSIKLLRRRYLKSPLPRSEDTHQFVRDSYVGGRVEPFEKKGRGLFYFDINSSYPAAMLELMPGGNATWWKGKPPARFQKNRIGFVEASVHVPENMHIPPLPIKGKKEFGVPEGKLIFPTGNLLGTWEWTELQMALELGCTIKEWHRSVWYEPVPLFREFVLDLYQYRDKSNPKYDEALAAVVKIMLNSAYGKFGMKTLRKKLYRWDDPDLPENAVPVMPDPESPLWYAEEEVDAPYIMPQIAARVTALGRVRLYRAMLEAQKRGGRVYYIDTDSVITDVELPTSSELGALKDEFPDYSGKLVGEFLAPKLYMLSADGFEKIKAKGLQKRDRETVERLARGETIYQKRLEKVGSLARTGFSRGPRMLTVPRTLRPDAGKRIFQPGENTSEPYYVEMW